MNRFLLSLAFITLAGSAAAALPWDSEPPLAEMAKSTVISGRLNALDPSQGGMGGANSPNTLSNPQIRASLWGPSNRVTLSLLKTDVWDRRYGIAPTVTLAEIREGAFAPQNQAFDDMPGEHRRPVRGFINLQGVREDRYLCWNAYPFPCEKPVGQIILGLDELASIDSPSFAQNCGDGVVRMTLKNAKARADVEILLPMTRNVIAVRAKLTGVGSPWIRLFRHVDQSFLRYMTADKKSFRALTPGAASGRISATPGPTNLPFDYAKDAAWNGPIDPPESGTDGTYFWIHQRFPPEKTFPRGFDYVMMGLVSGGATKVDTADGLHGLGTLPTGGEGSRMEDGYRAIRAALGSAASASLRLDSGGTAAAYITVVTCNEAADIFAQARRKLDAAAADGFDRIASENAAWFSRFYAKRENGRIYVGTGGKASSESVAQDFRSWFISHGGGNTPDMREHESTASYANVEQDWQLWHSLPCYNELFYTPIVVRNRSEPLALWWDLVEAWRPAAEKNMREVYHADGGAVVHGYLPPVKEDAYVHTNVALEFCIDTMAQMVRPLWDEWDYSGNLEFLKSRTYPAMRDLALFYASYAQKRDDGKYHFSPAMEAEAWGIFPRFRRGEDSISSLCMAKWTFERAAAAAEILGVDEDRRHQWLDIASKLAPYPVYQAKDGMIFNSMNGTVPSHETGDHPFYIGHYPTLLSDEINLDSPAPEREMMIRTALDIRTSQSNDVLMLLGASRRSPSGATTRGGGFRSSGPAPESLINSRSGRIHLFPDVAPGAVVAFRNFQARGGFLVSAARDKGGVTYLEIDARRDGPCRVMNPWPGSRVSVRAASGTELSQTVDQSNGECLVFEARSGGQYKLAPVSIPPGT